MMSYRPNQVEPDAESGSSKVFVIKAFHILLLISVAELLLTGNQWSPGQGRVHVP